MTIFRRAENVLLPQYLVDQARQLETYYVDATFNFLPTRHTDSVFLYGPTAHFRRLSATTVQYQFFFFWFHCLASFGTFRFIFQQFFLPFFSLLKELFLLFLQLLTFFPLAIRTACSSTALRLISGTTWIGTGWSISRKKYLSHKREYLQYQICDKSAHKIFSISGVQKRHVNHTDIRTDILCENSPLFLNLLIILCRACGLRQGN